MKRLIAALLCLVMFSMLPSAFAADLTLPVKMQRQMQHDGNGLKGSLTILGNADSVDQPFISAIQNAEYSILRNASGEQWHLIVFQTDESEQQYSRTELYHNGETLYLRSDFLPDQVYNLPAEALIGTFLNLNNGENPEIVSAFLSMINLSDSENTAWDNVAARYGKMLEIWMGNYINGPELVRGEDGSSLMNLIYVVPFDEACNEIAELITTAATDPEVIALMDTILTPEEKNIYLNPYLGDFYADALKSLGIQEDIRFVKTVTALGDMVASEITIPLPAAIAGFSSLGISIRDHRIAYTLSGEKQVLRVILPEDIRELTAADTYELCVWFIRIEQDPENTDKNIACRADIKRTTEKSYDEEAGKEHETHHYTVSLSKDTAYLPDGTDESIIPPSDTAEIKADFHYSGKVGPNAPTTLNIDIQMIRGDLEVSVAGKLKTASTWPFVPFPADQSVRLMSFSGDAASGYVNAWIQRAAGEIRRIENEPTEQQDIQIVEGE